MTDLSTTSMRGYPSRSPLRALEQDLRTWDDIENHRTGVPGDTETSDWLAMEILQAGLEPVFDSIILPRWELKNCAVEIDGKRVEGVPLFDGGTTDAHGIEDLLHPLGEGEGEGNGIGIGTLGPMASEETRTVTAARQQENHRGIVAIAAMNDDVPGLALHNAEQFTEPFGPPVLQVATEHGDWLLQSMRSGATARLTVAVDQYPCEASNMQVHVPGSDADLAPLVVMTPKSGWWTCTSERGGGIAIWLAAMRHLAANPPKRAVLFTANTGHELGHLGLAQLLEDHPDLVQRSYAWLHLGANLAARGGNVLLQVSDTEMESIALEAMQSQGEPPAQIRQPGERPGGEAENIFDQGGRYLSLLGSNPWFHHPDDRWPDAIGLEKTHRLVHAVLAMIDRLVR